MKALITAGLLTFVSLFSAPSPARTSEKSNDELQCIANSLLGNWKLKVKFEPTPNSPNGIEGSGEEVWQLTPGGLMLIDEESFGAGSMKMQIVGLFWADGVSHELRALDCNNENQHTCDLKDAKDGIAVRWNGTELIVEEPESFQGKQMISRIVWSKITTELLPGRKLYRSAWWTIHKGHDDTGMEKVVASALGLPIHQPRKE